MPIILGGEGGGSSSSSGSSTTLGVLIGRLRGGRDNPKRDTLSSELNATANPAFSLGTIVPPDALISIGFETIKVLTKPTPTTSTVARGWAGTTASTHASGAEVLVSPLHSNAQYRDAINAGLRAITSWFGQLAFDESQSYASNKVLIQGPSTARRLIDLYMKPSSETNLVRVPSRVMDVVPTSLISSGKAFKLESRWNPDSGTAYILYEKAWPELTALTDGLESSFPTEAIQCLELAAMLYLADEDAFARYAFASPHAHIGRNVGDQPSIRLQAREFLIRYLQLIQPIASRYRQDPEGWMKD